MARTVGMSEYSRRVAHELDDLRETWSNKRQDVTFLSRLPDSIKLKIAEDIDHAILLGDKQNLREHLADATLDHKTIHRYVERLGEQLNRREFVVDGQVVSRYEFQYHRDLMIRFGLYKQDLSVRLKQQVTRHNVMHDLVESHGVNFAGQDVPLDVEIVRNLVRIIREANRSNEPLRIDGNDDIIEWLRQGERYLGREVDKYLSNIGELYPEDVVDPTSPPKKVKSVQRIYSPGTGE